MVRPSLAMERRGVPGELEQRAGQFPRSRSGRQCDLRHQWADLPGSRSRDLARGPDHARPDAAGLGILEPQRADEFAGTDRQEPAEREFRQGHHGNLQQRRCRLHAGRQPVRPDRRAERQFALGDYQTFVQASAAHSGHSFTQAGANPTIAAQGFVSTTRLRFEDPPFTTVDAAAGIAKDAWNAQLFVENLANANTSLFTNADQYIVAQTPMRPRIIGVKFGYSF